MRPDFFDHYLHLIAGVSVLSLDNIPVHSIEIADKLLHKFVQDFQLLYGLQFCSINVHQLLHLSECVKNMGPLSVHLCYRYEDLNGQFLKRIHGTWHIDSQIARLQVQFISMTRKLDSLPEGEVRNFCLRKKKQVKLIEQISEQCYSVGAYGDILIELPQEIEQALRQSEICINRIQIYKRLLKNSKLYIAEQYRRNMKTSSSYANFKVREEEAIGSIHCFIKAWNDCECIDDCNCEPEKHYAIIELFRREKAFFMNIDHNAVAIPHLYQCTSTKNLIAIDVNNLISVCVVMIMGERIFVGLPVNLKEIE